MLQPSAASGFRQSPRVEADAGIGPATDTLRLLSFNVQVGIHTGRYRHYVTRGWKHLLPDPGRLQNLERIATLARDYDLVALQEVDSGSLRSGFVNQVEFLAQRSGLEWWYAQRNRHLGPLAQHGNGVLARRQPGWVHDHKLPGIIPGRGAIVLPYVMGGAELVVIVSHLSLGARARARQLDYIARIASEHPHVVLMGDLNTHADAVLAVPGWEACGLRPATLMSPTWPSWAPSRPLDHIFVSPGIAVRSARVLDVRLSDHCPVAVEIGLRPATVH